ncbi:MAG: VWA domain-containing protein, partial [Chloroflexales bacterium]|nr:VWA domain-containing protein [Chloroflexales bacterium]
MQVQPSSPMLAIRKEPQLCYILLTLNTSTANAKARAVNWAFIADASRSMRIPIISEDQFRYLARAGGAQEILVDGVPVWQLTSPVPPEIR